MYHNNTAKLDVEEVSYIMGYRLIPIYLNFLLK